ncbi:MAG TPA: hypothetical protein VFV38_40870 [Ktedonobacteraceae bacterium]|nr:hypothetical protein [Ktedonobacteraceae bacterium]
MHKQATSAQLLDSSSCHASGSLGLLDPSAQPDFITVQLDSEMGAARVLVPAGATVEHFTWYFEAMDRYFIGVFVGETFVGLHCGERTGELIAFSRKRDADRLCRVCNAARRSVKEVA